MLGLINLAVVILTVIATWKMFEKANYEGWKSIIPFYNDYTCCKIGNCIKLFWVKLGLTIGGFVIFSGTFAGFFATVMVMVESETIPSSIIFEVILFIIAITMLIAACVISVITNIKFVKRYSNDNIFAIFAGIGAFVPLSYTIVLCVLGFSNSYHFLSSEDNSDIISKTEIQ